MSNLNQCFFTGRLTDQPELKTTPTGKKVCSFNLANEKGYGERKKTVFPTLVAWNGHAEFISKLAKGTKIAVVAEYDERSWQTKNGEKRKAYEFIVQEVESQDPKRTAEESPQNATETPPKFEDILDDEEMPF